MTFKTIETNRLLLQKLSPEIMNQIFKENNDEEIKNILGYSEEEFVRQKKIYEKGYESYNQTMMNFQIVEKASSKIMGKCGFHTWNPQHHRAEIGYALNDDEFKNKGFMKEALEKTLEFGFQEMNLNRIEALIDENNLPSKKLLDYFGFVREGNLRGHYLVDGVFEDSVVFSLLKSEYNLREHC